MSCNVTGKINTHDITGKYVWTGYSHKHFKTIELFADNTFKYVWNLGLLHETINGTWEIESNNIILNSELQPSSDYSIYTILKKKSIDQNQLTVFITGHHKVPLPYASLVLKIGDEVVEHGETNLDGHLNLPIVVADSMFTYFVGYRTARIKFDNKYNYYEIQLNDTTGHYRFFTNEKWHYDNGRLYDPKISNHTDLKKYYNKR